MPERADHLWFGRGLAGADDCGKIAATAIRMVSLNACGPLRISTPEIHKMKSRQEAQETNRLQAEASQTNWLGNKVELPSLTLAQLHGSQVAAGLQRSVKNDVFQDSAFGLGPSRGASHLRRGQTELFPRATVDHDPRFPRKGVLLYQ
jgi:hypothetical protein